MKPFYRVFSAYVSSGYSKQLASAVKNRKKISLVERASSGYSTLEKLKGFYAYASFIPVGMILN